jgi:predicted RNA-binding protein YlqC (UPF0109 family)
MRRLNDLDTQKIGGCAVLLKDVTETLVRTLVDNPEQVHISTIDGAQSSLVEIRVSKTDLGQIIGRQGQIVEALRSILKSVAAKDRKRVVVDVID